ncbi:MAG: sugar phosphate isomerase/epimerase family protein [Bacillota bacterium]|jgi:sugar phosphate isomerase/epimerase
MDLKLGGCTYPYLYRLSVEEACQSLARLGFRYVELMSTPPHIWVRGMDGAARNRLKKVIEDNGMEVVAINPTFLDINMTSLNPAMREEAIVQMTETLDLVADIGAKIAVIMIGRRHPLIPAPMELTWRSAKEAVLRCLDVAERRGVVFGLEITPALFMNTSEDIVKMTEEINSPSLKVVYDVANGLMSEDPAEGLRRIAPYLIHVHLSDSTPDRWGHWPVGEGSVDFAGTAKVLREIGYEGVSILELTECDDPDVKYRESVERLREYGWCL